VSEDDITLWEGTYVQRDGEMFTGEVVETADDGTVVSLNTYVDGLEDGPQREWYQDGARLSEYQARQGMAVGEALRWHDNGQLAGRRWFDQYGSVREREAWDEQGNSVPE
jgi:antitoxin component YwqK of YwqJK toxin-antitoxin module